MNVESAVMTIPWHQAYTQYEAYRKVVKEQPLKATRDDVSLYRALWQIKRGQKVIDLNRAIGMAARDSQGRPKLAIARADWPHVYCDGSNEFFQFSTRTSHSWGRKAAGEVRVPLSAFVSQQVPRDPSQIRCRAQVPLIPPSHRPDAALDNYHILFEAEWGNVSPDPMLLRYIDGPFYVVLATWDLTPLEQAVLRQRL